MPSYGRELTLLLSHSNSMEDAERDYLTCPFCRFKSHDFDLLQNHVSNSHTDRIESDHKEGSNDRSNLSDQELAQLLAFEEAGIPAELALMDFPNDKSKQSADEASSEDDLWIDCFCGERILLQEIDIHSNMHQLEAQDTDDLEDSSLSGGTMSSSPSPGPVEDISNSPIVLGKAHQITARRLGKHELGPYAYEERMPKWLHNLLSKNTGVRDEYVSVGNEREFHYPALQNETSLLVPKLQRLSRADPAVLESVFCSPMVNHISKLFKEGGFCGYRNIQMMVSYLRGSSNPEIARRFRGRLPTIFELQHDIEAAWDQGIHAVGRVETGGIKDTRKYIGTAEAAALFMSKRVDCRTEAFSTTTDLHACDAMLASVKQHFTKSRGSHLPAPIYLQHKGHSMTVVGLEELVMKGESNATNLIIFDPMFRPSKGLSKLSGNCTKPEAKLNLLAAHRYSRQKFKRFHQFELLFLEK